MNVRLGVDIDEPRVVFYWMIVAHVGVAVIV